jgi:DNA-binding NtrC family response regulator
MPGKAVVILLDDSSAERAGLSQIAEEFGFEVHSVDSLSEVANLQKQNGIAVLLVGIASGQHWEEVLANVRSTVSNRTRVILCHRPELADFRSQMVAGGAFYTLLTPLVGAEIRQALGFAWAADRDGMHQIRPRLSEGATLGRVGAA